jgi:hypothetical protein
MFARFRGSRLYKASVWQDDTAVESNVTVFQSRGAKKHQRGSASSNARIVLPVMCNTRQCTKAQE